MNYHKYAFLILFFAFALSCAKSSESEDTNSNDGKKNSKSEDSKKSESTEVDLTKCGNGTSLSYENFGENLFLKHCLRCHSDEKHKVDLSTLDQLHIWKNSILALSVQDNKMPPDYNLAASDKELLLEWISCGLP